MAVLPFYEFSKFGKEDDNLKWLKYTGRVEIRMTSSEVFEQNVKKLTKLSEVVDTIVDCSSLSIDQCYSVLNAGALAIAVTEEMLPELSSITPSRLVLKTSCTDVEKLEKCLQFASSIQLVACESGYRPEFLEKMSKIVSQETMIEGGSRVLYLEYPSMPSMEQLKSISVHSVTPVLTSAFLTVDKAETDKLHLADLILVNAVTDRPDGLYTTLVVDELGGALGLVYSSKESVAESMKTGTGVYQSRKRGLWYKGATSGAVQHLIRIDLDCDHDCIRFVVYQTGKGFCHLDTQHCFGHSSGLPQLERVLKSRKQNAPAGSYTARLFSDPTLLRAKIMEEAEELCDAATKDEVTWEMADLIYFAMTRCVAAGVSLEDISRHLDLKHRKVTRRAGNAKAAWTAKLEGKAVADVKESK
ncbi:phosphoribosyl-AMP cyclohydrolase/phosphoribosyl- ATP pyrophosphohydrolase His7 [Schizosaccharomyces japonicus yFS275]|uniref:Phosphoribosyl-AMP cyclohydrolase/phosphoribosyl-ATP pyrophosphohydrolase His7 n=1 Tax=Schizosaccharomyces japonicus (strain yFS275 / FY16936) TaxID=402676 RepID=B6K2D2_SCHJY|nr:phosphoribosyl-AMP cyclohydrolase/phosphoribosyl- ATP pyrophosphohydrolase His7 [Schizosaccharomyces japonicus yFS275]EEB07313.1 phosphoribosyl-AMP cyclohydrolase/phosphoribosyl- ATP pyrophosphohydrolase His7 [Schizosaccharomyces japonicus yFS275]